MTLTIVVTSDSTTR